MSTPHASGDVCYPWADFLRRVSPVAIERAYRDVPEHLMADAHLRGWLGAPGAGDDEIVRHEQRLGVRLPLSYREFLRVTNGWDVEGIARGRLLPIDEIGWLRDLDPHLAGFWSDGDPVNVPDEDYFVYGDDQDTIHFRGEYVPDTLMIGEHDDGTYLLNPHIQTSDGEWEAWYLAPWLAGAWRFPSFWDLMSRQLQEYTEIP